MLQRFQKRDGTREIFEDKWTVSEKIESIIRVLASQDNVRFSELFEDATSRSEVVCTFLALLELIRLKQLVCAQGSEFSEIEIRRATTFNDAIPPSVEPVAAMPEAPPIGESAHQS